MNKNRFITGNNVYFDMLKVLIMIMLMLPFRVSGNASIFISFEGWSGNLFAGIPHTVKVYRDSILDVALSDSLKSKTFLHAKNVSLGNYNFVYSNIWGIECAEKIIVSEEKIYWIKLYMDHISFVPESFSGMIGNIKEKEPFTIEIKTNSCYATAENKISVYLKEEKYFISYFINIHPVRGKAFKEEKSKEIGKEELNRLKQIEYEMDLIEEHRVRSGEICISSAQTFYTISSGNNKKKFITLSCDWEGLKKFTKDLFFNDNEN